jgi:hypothetical protein
MALAPCKFPVDGSSPGVTDGLRTVVSAHDVRIFHAASRPVGFTRFLKAFAADFAAGWIGKRWTLAARLVCLLAHKSSSPIGCGAGGFVSPRSRVIKTLGCQNMAEVVWQEWPGKDGPGKTWPRLRETEQGQGILEDRQNQSNQWIVGCSMLSCEPLPETEYSILLSSSGLRLAVPLLGRNTRKQV